MSEMNSASFVWYESFYKQAQILEKKRGKDVAYDFVKAVMEFGLYGVIPDEDDDVWMYGFEQTITSIDKAKDRYNKAVENGKKGGRPKKYDDQLILELKKQGLSNSAIAVKLGCSTKTIERAIAAMVDRESDKTDKRVHNLNDNDNDNVNEKLAACASSPASSMSHSASRCDEGEGTIDNPYIVSKEWLAARCNKLTQLANGLFGYENKFYRIG